MPGTRWIAVAAALAAFAAGCGGGDGPATDGPRLGAVAPKKDATVVAALGDSITAGAPAWDPDAAIRRRMGVAADPESQYEYWAQLRLKGTRFRNCGVSGERTDEIARRLGRCAKGADVLVIQGGVNDIAQRRDIGLAADDLERMVRRGECLGLRVALVELLPWNNGNPAADASIRELNRLIRGIGRQEHVPVFAWYGRLEDPRTPGRMRRAWTAEGDHPSVEGYRRLAETVELP